jgi:hypothetical protein
MPNLVLHLGYPKTATTTFQQHLFPNHPEIEYVGKFIPNHKYKEPELFDLIDCLYRERNPENQKLIKLKNYIEKQKILFSKKTILISSESFMHPTAYDVKLIIERIKQVFFPCRVWVTFRDQLSLLKSFYLMHGQFGQYLYIDGLYDGEKLKFPLKFNDWIKIQKRAPDKNLIGIIKYYEVAKKILEVFDRENALFTFYEDLVKDPQCYVNNVSDFLKIDKNIAFSLISKKTENKSKERHGLLKKLGLRNSSIISKSDASWIQEFYYQDNRMLRTII